ncbi:MULTISPECIES: DMT family transporter [Cyanophyceae]|uniref:DMT family transporter n=1 Tax=Leptolyngbya subtilissima DQ-A4 TaxID=2933933 RepID=A0ABV0K8Z2_9CYAN|nr:DMT family transporter [Nodosilinea sp. FACHB-141]MBD2110680.1 DMT family transporter [Nodosilinea sp. FACHB-141]
MRKINLAELLLLAALWGGSFLFMRVAVPVLGPLWLIEIRVVLAGCALLPVVVHLNLWPELRQRWRALLVIGSINSAIPFVLLAFASLSLPAGLTSTLNSTAPLFGTVVAAVWLQEALTLTRWIGFGLGFVGVVILVGWQPIMATPGFGWAVAAGLVAAFMYAIAAPYIRQNLAGVSPWTITAGSLWGAALALLPALPFTVPHQLPTPTVVAAVVALALLSTACAYLLYFRLIQNVGSTKALTVGYLIPMFAVLWGAVLLAEPVTESMAVGGSLILPGTAIANDLFNPGQKRAQTPQREV